MNRKCPELFHISELVKPETAAFVSYVINTQTNQSWESLHFAECRQKFEACETSHVMVLKANDQIIREYWIIEKKGIPAAMASRNIVNGVVNGDSIGFYQFVMRSYDCDRVVAQIANLDEYSAIKSK